MGFSIAAGLLAAGVVFAIGLAMRRVRARERAARDAAETAVERCRLAMRAAEVGAWERDLERGTITVSEELRSVFGLDPEVELGDHRAWLAGVHPDDRQRIETAFRDATNGRSPYVAEYRFVREDGSVRWIATRGTVLPAGKGGPRRMIGIAMDVTERRMVEEAMRASEARYRATAERLRESEERLTLALRRKDEFLAMLGHELRNPLAAVRNAVVTAVLDPARRERALQVARRQTDQLSRLVDDMLDLARISEGKLELRMEPVFLANVVERAVESVRELIEDRGHALVVSLPDGLELEADGARLQQVFANLMSNAARYTPVGGRIELAAQRDGESVVVRVRDNGSGIAAEALPHVFDAFAQSEESADGAQNGGLGLGLTVVRRIVELHRGRVTIRSEGLARGTEVCVQLPALPAGRVAAPDAAVPALLAARARRVLLVEDDADAAEALAMLLEVLGHAVRVVGDGAGALELAAGGGVDVMLVDLGLPGLDGCEVARRIRALPGGPAITLVALTGYGRDEDRERTRDAGFDHHLVKPVDLEALQALVARDRSEPDPTLH